MTAVFDKQQIDIFGMTYEGNDTPKIIKTFDKNNEIAVVRFTDSSLYFSGHRVASVKTHAEFIESRLKNVITTDALDDAVAFAKQLIKVF